jgi:N-acetylneuraminic acid mutarotase
LTLVPLGGATVGSWRKAPPLEQSRAAHAVVATADAIYALGGSGPGSAVVERFDGSAWRAETTLPGGPVNAPAAAVVGTKIYVIGGFSGTTNEPLTRVDVYDTATKVWSSAAPLPAPRGGHAAVVLGGKIHVIGGGNSVSTIADHSVYDPATDTWTDAASLPRAEGSPATVAFGGKLYAIGGRSGLSDYGTVYVYDPARNRWGKAPAVPPRGTAGAAVYRGAIYLFGGESQSRGKVLGDVYRLRSGAASWQKVSTLPTPRNYARAVVFGGAVYVVGGSRSFGDSHGAAGSTVVERYSIGR